MFSQNKLSTLYPNLNFSRLAPPSRSVSLPPKAPIEVEPVKTPIPVPEAITVKPEVVQTTEPETSRVTEKELAKKPKKDKRVAIGASETVEPTEPEQAKPPPKPKISRPNRVKAEPKPEPVRASVIPKTGERGLQRKYSIQQRKQIYLDKLSRKSVKNAEKEIEQVNKVLEKNNHDVDKLKEEERATKRYLSLINTAKYFTTATNIKNDPSESQTSPINPVEKCNSESIGECRGRGSGKSQITTNRTSTDNSVRRIRAGTGESESDGFSADDECDSDRSSISESVEG
jgi:hypothetical protein